MIARDSSRRHEFSSPLFPLDQFYESAGLALPRFKQLDGREMLEPYRGLLVHNGDMTPALENHYRKTIHIHLLQARRKKTEYSREVVLLLNGDNRPVEFGAIRINLELFNKKAREEIVEAHIPLGTILREYNIVHTSSPRAYLQVKSDGVINNALELPRATALFGRRNTLSTPAGEPLAEIVEILAPAL